MYYISHKHFMFLSMIIFVGIGEPSAHLWQSELVGYMITLLKGTCIFCVWIVITADRSVLLVPSTVIRYTVHDITASHSIENVEFYQGYLQ